MINLRVLWRKIDRATNVEEVAYDAYVFMHAAFIIFTLITKLSFANHRNVLVKITMYCVKWGWNVRQEIPRGRKAMLVNYVYN